MFCLPMPQNHPYLITFSLSLSSSDDAVSVCVLKERMGKVAPSVFSGVRTGAETSLEHKPKASGGSVFSK